MVRRDGSDRKGNELVDMKSNILAGKGYPNGSLKNITRFNIALSK